MTDSHTTTPDPAPVLEATQARQGFRGKHVLWVLVISLVLVVLALFGSFAFHAPGLSRADPNGTSRTAAAAQAFDAPEPAAKQTDVEKVPGVAGDAATESPVTQAK